MTPEEMADLHRTCFVVPRPWSVDEFAELLRDPKCFAEQTVHGFALGRVIADEAELLTLAVAPPARRGGQGFELMTAFAETAKRRGAQEALLEVAADNIAALALYAACGFVQVGQRPGYYAGKDALILRKML